MLRIEREKKYEEARDRIFGRSSASASPVPSAGEKKVWEPMGEKEKGVLPIRGPKGPSSSEGKGFGGERGRGRGRGGRDT